MEGFTGQKGLSVCSAPLLPQSILLSAFTISQSFYLKSLIPKSHKLYFWYLETLLKQYDIDLDSKHNLGGAGFSEQDAKNGLKNAEQCS